MFYCGIDGALEAKKNNEKKVFPMTRRKCSMIHQPSEKTREENQNRRELKYKNEFDAQQQQFTRLLDRKLSSCCKRRKKSEQKWLWPASSLVQLVVVCRPHFAKQLSYRQIYWLPLSDTIWISAFAIPYEKLSRLGLELSTKMIHIMMNLACVKMTHFRFGNKVAGKTFHKKPKQRFWRERNRSTMSSKR